MGRRDLRRPRPLFFFPGGIDAMAKPPWSHPGPDPGAIFYQLVFLAAGLAWAGTVDLLVRPAFRIVDLGRVALALQQLIDGLGEAHHGDWLRHIGLRSGRADSFLV